MSKSTLAHEVETDSIAGYDYGRTGVPRSPVSFDELRQLEETVGWRAEDAQVLQRHGDLFRENAEHIVDSWRAVIGAQPYLAKWFFGPDGKPDDQYKAKVKNRFVQWVLDVCFRPHDRAARLSRRDRIAPYARKEESDGWHPNTVACAASLSDRIRSRGGYHDPEVLRGCRSPG
jgi:hypothetical protein